MINQQIFTKCKVYVRLLAGQGVRSYDYLWLLLVRHQGICQYCAGSHIHSLPWMKQTINFDKKQCYPHGTLLVPMWQPGWVGSLEENGYMCI